MTGNEHEHAHGGLGRLQAGAEQAMHVVVNGLDWWLREPSDVVDRTHFEIAHEHGKLRVRRYRAEWDDYTGLGSETGALPPVLLIPPLMVKPFIFDLSPTRSFVRTLTGAGFDVFLADFGEPDRSDRRVTLDRYVLDFVPAAVDAAARHSPDGRVALIGYCQGGMFALMHTAAHRDERVSAIVTIGSPVDSHRMGPVAWLMRVAHAPIDLGARLCGNLPGALSSRFFMLLNPLASVTRYADLLRNLHDEDFVDAFDALSAWTQSFVDYPRDAFRQLMREFFVDNKLRDGRMTFGDKACDLGSIRCPVLAFAGSSDRIVPPAAVREIVSLVSNADTEVRVVPGGHMGVFAGRAAVEQVWRHSARWLAERTRNR